MLRCGLIVGFAFLVAEVAAQDRPPVDAATGEPHPPVVLTAPSPADLNRAMLRFVEDDAPVRAATENPDEARAYDYLIGFASRVPGSEFAKVARSDLSFAHLLGPEAHLYRGEVVRIEGRLKRVRDLGPTTALRAEGVGHLYEAWVFSEIYRGYSYCLLLTELPSDVTVSEQLDRKVRCDAFFYKIYRFVAGDGVRRAPLLIGRSLETVTPAADQSRLALQDQALLTLPSLLAALIIGLLLAAGFVVYFRLADKRTRDRLAAARQNRPIEPPVFRDVNPFDGSPSRN